jgi:peptide/nickel transport system ATP-binding protein
MLEIESLTIHFRRYDGLWRRRAVTGLTEVTLDVTAGEVLAVVGSSGAGKSLLAHAILGILPRNAVVGGQIRFEGAGLDAASLRTLRGRRIALVPQSIAHLDPLARVGDQVRWAARRAGLPRGMAQEACAAALQEFGLSEGVAEAYPHAVSGGMARRVLLATAMVGHADLVIADEPTDGLDPANAALVLRHLRGLAERGKAVILVTHDLVSALPFATGVAVMRDGALLGIERAEDFSADGAGLRSPYARALWRALPENGFAVAREPRNA